MRKIGLMIPFLGFLLGFTACSEDDSDGADGTATSQTKSGMSFIANAKSATRTSGSYGTSMVDFKWTEGDYLWVDLDSTNTTLQKSSDAVDETGESYTFHFKGSFTKQAYKVYYTNGSAGNTVTIASEQSQSTPNNSINLGDYGDCGVSTAYLSVSSTNDSTYNFTLQHKASYITFTPYYSTEELGQSVYVRKIVLQAGSSEVLAGTFGFGSSGIDASTASSTADTIALTLGADFNVPTSATPDSNAAVMVVKPGTYSTLTVTYYLYDSANDESSTISNTYSNVTLTAGKNTRISRNLTIPNSGISIGDFWMWGASQYYWYEYESVAPTTYGGYNVNYPTSSSDSRWYDTTAGRNSGTSTSAETTVEPTASCPNVHELFWYLYEGDPHIEVLDTAYIVMGQLRTGIRRLWLKKQSVIVSEGQTSKDGTTITSTSELASTWPSSMPITYRANSLYQSTSSNMGMTISSGIPSNTSDYFVVWGVGQYVTGTLNHSVVVNNATSYPFYGFVNTRTAGSSAAGARAMYFGHNGTEGYVTIVHSGVNSTEGGRISGRLKWTAQ